MQINGYILKLKQDSSEIQRWSSLPGRIDLPDGDIVFGVTETWENDLYIFEPFTYFEEEPELMPVSTPPKVVAAAYNIHVANGDVQSIEGSYNILAALYMGTGQYMLLYLNELNPVHYISLNKPTLSVTEKAVTHCVIENRDESNNLVDVNTFNILINEI